MVFSDRPHSWAAAPVSKLIDRGRFRVPRVMMYLTGDTGPPIRLEFHGVASGIGDCDPGMRSEVFESPCIAVGVARCLEVVCYRLRVDGYLRVSSGDVVRVSGDCVQGCLLC